MRFSFVHAADLHLDTPFRGIGRAAEYVSEALRDASLEAFDRLVELAIDRDVAFVLLAGDIYDGPERGVRAQLRFYRGLERLNDASIYSFVVHGNHDPLLTGWSAIRDTWPDLVKVFGHDRVDQFVIEKDGEPFAIVHGISFSQRAEMENLALRYRRSEMQCFQVGMLHCNVGGNVEHDPYAPCTLADLKRANLDYWALGHIHTRQILSEGHPWVVYPGNLQGRGPGPGELGEKGAFVVEVDGRTAHTPEFVPLDVVRFERLALDVGQISDLPELERALQDKAGQLQGSLGGRSMILKPVLTGSGPLHADLAREGTLNGLLQDLRDEAGEGVPFLWWEPIVDQTRAALDFQSIRRRGDFAGELLALADQLGTDEEARRQFVGAALAELQVGELEANGVAVPDGSDPECLREAATAALELLAGAE